MNKKMMTGIIYIAIGIILMAIFGAIGNYHIQKARTESAKSNKDEILTNQDSIKNTVLVNQTKSKNEIIDSVSSNKEEVIANTNELKEGQKNIEKQIEATSKSKKPDIKVENSPNTVIQVNESGDNVIDNRQTIINQEVGIPEPTLNILHNKKNIKNDKLQFINEFLVDIKTALPIPKVYFIANGNFISDIEVRSPSGVQFSVLKRIDKKRAEYSFSNLSEGRYRVLVTSNESDNIIIHVGK